MPNPAKMSHPNALKPALNDVPHHIPSPSPHKALLSALNPTHTYPEAGTKAGAKVVLAGILAEDVLAKVLPAKGFGV